MEITCCIIGRTQLAVDCSKILLHNGITIGHVFTDDKSFWEWAENLKIKVQNIKEFQSMLTKYDFFGSFDFLFSIVNDIIISERVLKSVKKCSINYHNGPLPKYAGINATHWALLNGETKHGVVWHIMEKTIDSGAILTKKEVLIEDSDDITKLNWLCREAAKESLTELCNHITSGSLNPVVQKEKCYMKNARDKPTAFCVLPFNCSAQKVMNIFRATYDFGEMKNDYDIRYFYSQQVNIIGLPKLFLPHYNRVVIVTGISVLNECSNVQYVPGTVVSVLDHLRISTAENDIMITGLMELDGTPIAKPFGESIPCLKAQNLSLNDAQEPTSNLWKISKYSLHGKSEQEYLYNVYFHAQDNLISPLVWPYYSFSQSNSSFSQENEAVNKITIYHICFDTVVSVADSHKPEVYLLASFVCYLLNLSVTLSGSLDVCLQGFPDGSLESAFVLTSLPISLKLEPTITMNQSIDYIAKVISSTMFGSEKEGVRIRAIASDIYLRYSLQPLHNTLAIAISHNDAEVSLSTSHNIMIVCRKVNGFLNLDAHFNCKYFDSTNFKTVCKDFSAFLDNTFKNSAIQLCSLDSSFIHPVLKGEQRDHCPTKLHKPFEEVVAKMPHAIAVIDTDGLYTYFELNQRAESIAFAILNRVHNMQIRRVAYLLSRTCDSLAAMLAIMKIGFTFIPLEIDSRLKVILEDSKAEIILVDQGFNRFEDLKDLHVHIIIINIELVSNVPGQCTLTINPPLLTDNDNTAVIMYTSGTTGRPKGVLVEHVGLCNIVASVIQRLSLLNEGEFREYSIYDSSPIFDSLFLQIFCALWTGGTVLIVPVHPLEKTLCQQYYPHMTFFLTTPSKLSLHNPNCFKSLLNVAIGGENPNMDLYNKWKAPNRNLWNVYGPTETSVITTIGLIVDKVHMGKPAHNTQLHILSQHRLPVPLGVAGELYISGIGLAKGYTSKEQTEKAFIHDNIRLYRTGDLAFIDKDGSLQFVGRIPTDKQVKFRGMRVELVGIEYCLRQCKGIEYAEVVVEKPGKNISVLVAYVAPHSVSISDIESDLQKMLPPHAVPSLIIPINKNEAKLSMSGKLSLDKSKYIERLASNFCGPASSLEESILAVFKNHLGIKDDHLFGMTDQFKRYGGDSVIAVSLCEELAHQFGLSVEPLDILNFTPADLIKKYFGNAKKNVPIVKPLPISLAGEHSSLSDMQKLFLGMNVLCVGATYNVSFAFEIVGPVNQLLLVSCLEKSLQAIEYDFCTTGTNAYVKEIDLSSLCYNEAKAVSLQMAQKDACTPMDLKSSPYRCTLYHVCKDNYILTLLFHHIIFDYHSWKNFINIFEELYHSGDILSTNKHTPFTNYSMTEHQNYYAKRQEINKFWKDHLHGCPLHISLPHCFMQSSELYYRGNKFVYPLGNDSYNLIAKLSKTLDIHPSCFFIITFAVLIHQISRQNDFGIGIVVNRRTTADLKRIIGFVTKTFIFHFSSEILNKPLPFILRHFQSWQENAMKNGSIPFDELIQILGYNASYKGYHIPQFLFNFISDAKKPTIKLENDVNVKYLPLETHTCKGELVLDVSYSEDLSYSWEYNSLMFSEETISQCINETYLKIMHHTLENILCKAVVVNLSSQLPSESSISTQQPIYSGEPTTIPFSANQKVLVNAIIDTSQAMWGQFNSTCSFKISPNLKTEEIRQSVYKCIGNCHYLSSVVNGNNDSLCLANLIIHISVEDAKNEAERKAIICREHQWPFSLHTGPMFHITLICCTTQKELLLSASQVLLDEHSLHRLAWHLNSTIKNPALSMSSVDLPFTLAGQIDKMNIDQHCCEEPPRLMSNSAITLSSLKLMNFNYAIVSQRPAAFCCAFAALFLWYIHKNTHVQLCFLQSPKNNSLYNDETIIPIDQKLDKKMTFNHLLDCISDNVALLSNFKPECYWKLQKQFDPHSNYLQPYHELLVEIMDYDIELLEINYPRTFKLHLKFDIFNGTVSLTSNVDPEQNNVIQNIFNCLVGQFNHSEIAVLNSPISMLIENKISPSAAIGERQDIKQDLKHMITSSLKQYSGIIALCNSSSSEMMTYEELGKQSELLAMRLKKPLSNGIVAILVSGNFELHVAVTAAIISNFTFSILDPFEKPDMLSKLICASQASIVLFDSRCFTVVESIYLQCPVNFILVNVYVDPFVFLSNCTADYTDNNLQQSDITAYIVFTSGSTGEPKAVPISSPSLCNFLLWHKMVLVPCNGPLNWLQFSKFSFDLCIAEIVGQLYNGNTFFVIEQKKKLDLEGYYLKRLTSCNIDGVHVVPTFLKYLLKVVSDTNQTFPSLSHVFSGGEKLTKEMCVQFFKLFTNVSLHNWAGPAECSIAISHCIIDCSTCISSNIPVGLPVWNSEIRIVNPHSLEVVPKTILGEVVVSGIPVFDGYVNSKTKGTHFYTDENGKKYYRTSDIGFINNNNHLVLIDRLGTFRKVSGQSVDLEGVRALINRLTIPYVEDVIVMIIEDGNGENIFLGCFPIVSGPFEEDKIQSILVKSLPKQYTPIVVKCFKQQDIPMLASGKTDYKALKLIASKTKCSLSENVASNNFDSILYKCLSSVVSYNILESSSWIKRTLDSFGLSSMQKVQFYEMLCSLGVHVDISAILMPHSLRFISSKMSWKTKPPVSSLECITTSAGGLPRSEDESIAILTMRVNIQGAKSFSELWDIIINSKEEITHGLPSKSDKRASLLEKYVGSRGLVTEKEMFDAELFEISAFQADLIDPQQRVLLQMVWEALEETGYDPVKYSKKGRIGCFAGVEFPSYLLHSIKNADVTHENEIIWNNLRDNASLLIGRLLDFRGPCITVANNCATFSVALHCARNSLLQGECDIAVVATANLSADETGYFARDGDIYSFDGHCKPFSKSATGTVMSDGIVVAILKVLSDAKRDSDNIICTVCGSAVGSDGALAKKQQYVPSAAGQASTLEGVFISSHIHPNTITLVEAHGTGTRIGDQVELESLTTVFKCFGNPTEQKCALGSIKGNLGHIGVSAAGASVAKVALALKNRMLPSSINCEDPLTDLSSPFEIVQLPRPWIHPPSVGYNRRALVHSVGAMGINSAIILEEYINESQNESVTENLWFPVCISAKTKWSLERICHRLKVFLSQNKSNGSSSYLLQNMAYTLLIGRRFLPLRAATVVQSLGQLDEWLSSASNSSTVTANTWDNMCTIFSGQGYPIESPSCTFSSLARLLPEFGKVVKICCNILEIAYPEHFTDLADMLIQGTPKAHLELECIRTQHVLIVIFQVAMFSVLEGSGYTPTCVMGHSLGEYTAAYVAGLFSLESLLKIVFNRAHMIENSVPAGKMLAVHLSGKDFSLRYASFMNNSEVACYNSPNHCVISGSNDGVAEVFQRLNEDKVKCRYLSVQYAYHHSSLKCIETNFTQFLKSIPFGSLKYMFVTSTDVNVYLPGSTLNYSYFVKQLSSPVNFCKACDALFHDGLQINKEANITPIVTEIGIRNIIQSFLLVTDSNPKMDVVTFSLNTANDIKSVLNSLTSLWKCGTDIPIQDASIFSTAKRIQLPTYPFDMKRHWICKKVLSQSEQKITPLQTEKDQPIASLDSILEYINGFSVQGNSIDESLNQMTIRERILRNFNVDVAKLLEQKQSPKQIAEYVLATYESLHVSQQPSLLHSVTCLTPNSTAKINFFILHATRGNLYSFEPIASCLSFMFQIYAMYIPVSALKCDSMESYADFFLREISTLQPVGPYNIMGFSFGAWIAHAVVSILNTRGEKAVLFMLDPIPFQTIDEEVLKNPHRLVQTIIKYGNEFVQNALHYSESDVLLNFIQNFCEQYSLLLNYKHSYQPVSSPTTVILAMDGIALLEDQKYSSSSFWNSLCSSDKLMIKLVPGNHAACIGPIYCHHITDIVLQMFHVQIEKATVLISSVQNIQGNWKLQSCCGTDDMKQKLNMATIDQNYLKIINTTYICIIPKISEFLTELNISESKKIACFFNSAGTLETIQGNSEMQFCVECSFLYSESLPYHIRATIKVSRGILLLGIDKVVFSFSNI